MALSDSIDKIWQTSLDKCIYEFKLFYYKKDKAKIRMIKKNGDTTRKFIYVYFYM